MRSIFDNNHFINSKLQAPRLLCLVVFHTKNDGAKEIRGEMDAREEVKRPNSTEMYIYAL